jgi:hypothetical protein
LDSKGHARRQVIVPIIELQWLRKKVQNLEKRAKPAWLLDGHSQVHK